MTLTLTLPYVWMCGCLKQAFIAGDVIVAVQPENLLLVDKKDNANLKIADFGFAKKHDAGSEILKTQCGTPGCENAIYFVHLYDGGDQLTRDGATDSLSSRLYLSPRAVALQRNGKLPPGLVDFPA